ncbi:LL-diaminopimelate aminotransferase [Candidatus Azobacteroides pseudotrichonymphae]|uniref:LL-diaminopimelate aminotransferase n=1 Tax=Azobacteroides pseudotrichonymphae genomovar. CFP2 TaxID=511995 RepID=DAPAT_AZOPC|nr:LL-diaminopimelate aminotransferase [Candidatus Azobacteroides pseudotrichonymphae]B6YRL2.1 RecName: Full=LL-diaminopimelate aminotransferase; Short=DAP-AT; Short=DAP-aminotransferase; Short=LL-DAP-aminotransferase [Candidatus Azobacteroides pseudotrichonymphae genomovar. CFP2]BAG83834.1 putative LL-diaminopimelate aminotransferase [Candidatus Azobacteroides pseudotrichonymphae genomovar. CFP2]
MVRINEHYIEISNSYLFAEIAERVNEYKQNNKNREVISLGIGDVTQAIAPAVVEAIHKATNEMACTKTLRGYAPYEGYDFLIQAILKNDFTDKGISIEADEIFVNDGAKSDTGNIGDILGQDNHIAITDPAYPVYVDTNRMAGRTIELLPCTPENYFVPNFPRKTADVIYLCYPNNPTGIALNAAQLKNWVDYALTNKSLILFDAAYEAYISQQDVPHSIYEISDAKKVAIEFRSFSKTAGFTGLRAGYTIVPKELIIQTSKGKMLSLNAMWRRRQSTKFNGTAYIVQRGAEAVYSIEGQKQIRKAIDYYRGNALTIKEGLESLGVTTYGGINAPYIWVKTPNNLTSWEFFDLLLNKIQVIGTPGDGFGQAGKGFFRFTAFGNKEDTLEAVLRMKKLLEFH